MWDYDKLFAVGNIIGIKNTKTNKLHIETVLSKEDREFYIEGFGVNTLDYTPTNEKIQYIIRLDEHGNVVEKLFDREKDMVKPMPELETGMFVRVGGHKNYGLGFVDAENGRIIYQDGGYDYIDDDESTVSKGIASEIVEVYDKNTCGFKYCTSRDLIWRSPEYQAYLDSKSN